MSKKKKSGLPTLYFGEKEELAVLEFLYGPEENRDKVFKEQLNAPLNKMVESLIKRYRLYRDDISIEDLKNDTISFLLTKFDKFDPEENKKAYSYYGTICVNYLKSQLKRHNILRNKTISYEDISSDLDENPKYMYEINFDEKLEVIDFIPQIIVRISDEIEADKLLDKRKMKPNEEKVGYAIIDILENWEVLMQKDDKGNILARNKILLAIRDYTFLNAKEVRNALKKYKVLYDLIKKDSYGD